MKAINIQLIELNTSNLNDEITEFQPEYLLECDFNGHISTKYFLGSLEIETSAITKNFKF